MTLETFLYTLFNNFEVNNIKYSVLRNFETLPEVLKKGDIDVLVSKEHIDHVGGLIKSIEDIQIIGVTKREYVHNYFIYNIDKGGESRALQIDFIFKYIYKGTSYFDTTVFLNNVRVFDNKSFNIPTKFDETFLMFFPFYLATGKINKKYENIIIEVFQKHKNEFENISRKLGLETNIIQKFYNSILTKDYILLKEFSGKIKRKIFFKNLNGNDLIDHFLSEIRLRLPYNNSFSVKVKLNPENKNEIIRQLDSFAKNIVFIDMAKGFDFLKLFKIRPTYSMFIFYHHNLSLDTNGTMREITAQLS